MPMRHFAGVPVFAIILKIFAAISFVVSIAGGVIGIMSIKGEIAKYTLEQVPMGAPALDMLKILGAFKDPILVMVSGLVLAIAFWAFAEVITMVREIEFNTRVAAGIKEEVVAEEDYSAPAVDTIIAE